MLFITSHMLFIYLQINSTDTIGTKLNLFAGAESGNSDYTGNKYIIITFCFPLIFVLYSIIFKNLFKSLFQKSNPNFILYISLFSQHYHTLSFKYYFHSNFPFVRNHIIPQRLYPSFHSINTSPFFHKISHQILTHLSNSYLISILSSSLTRMAKWIETLFLTVITIATVIMTFFCLYSPEECGPAMVALPIIYMLLFIAWVINRHS